ncbi:MAG: DUF4136 domain-containing protein [Nitrospirota bacterium]|jgi:hypothetical protein
MRKGIVVFWAAFLLWGCAGMDYSYRYDPGVNYGQLKTYSFMPISEKGKEDTILLMKGMRFAVNQDLEARGYRRVTENPDFLVALHAVTEQRVDVQQYGYAYSPGFYEHPAFLHRRPFWGRPEPFAYSGPGYYEYRSGVDVYKYRVATLVVDIVRADQKELVWRGTAHGELGEDATQKDIRKIVDKILRGFPPPASR